MITVKVNSKEIDVPVDIKIDIKVENPLFAATFINEGYSYAFSLPRTPKNIARIKGENSTFDLFFKGNLVFRAYIVSFSNNSSSIDVNVITEGKYFRKQCELLRLEELDLKIVEICEEDDHPADKIEKWQDYMQATLSIPKLKQTHVFPMITSKGYNNFDEPAESGDENHIFEYGERLINRNIFGEYKLNFQTSLALGDRNWITTVAPCLKLPYLLNRICSKFGLNIRINQLENIQEYLDDFVFNNYVLDKLEYIGPSSYNVHGTEIDERNHVPDANLYSILEHLNETFGAYFVVKGNQIDIFVEKNVINRKPIDFTKFAEESFDTNPQEALGNNFTYEIEEELADFYKTFDVNSDPNDPTYIYPLETRNFPFSKITNNENALKSIPMITSMFGAENGFPQSNGEYLDFSASATPWTNYGWGQIFSRAFSPYYLKSDLYENDAVIFDKIFFGCFRGVYPGSQPYFDEITGEYTPAGNTYFDHPYTYSFKVGGFLGQTLSPEIEVQHVFGQSSVYQNYDDNCFDLYKITKQALLSRSTVKTKLITIPLYKLLQQLEFKDCKHVYQQKNESFIGLVKSYSFTLSNKGLSSVKPDYVVRNTNTSGEFGTDWNNDFDLE